MNENCRLLLLLPGGGGGRGEIEFSSFVLPTHVRKKQSLLVRRILTLIWKFCNLFLKLIIG